MKAVILCPGPSLARLIELPPCDISIAINRAALKFACQWWASLDYPMLRDNQAKILGNPQLLTRRQTYLDLHKRLGRFAEIRIVEDMADAAGYVKTLPCAMVFAHTLGAKRIDLYGVDWQGDCDFDGVKAGENRSEERWRLERLEVTGLMEWLAGKGVEVNRIVRKP